MDTYTEFENTIYPLPREFSNAGLTFWKTEDKIGSDKKTPFRSFIFRNSTADITLTVTVSQTTGSFSAYVANSLGKGFTLNCWLSFKNRPEEWEKKVYKASAADFTEYLRGLVENDWHDILTGAVWIDVPYNWGSYK